MTSAAAPVPSPWIARFLCNPAPPASVLDVACGNGRHLRLALQTGAQVTAVDRDLTGLADLAGHPRLNLIEADLESGGAVPWRGTRYGAVIVTNYLWRPILPEIVAAVADDGVLLYETFAAGNERLGRPTNPDFLLRPNELAAAAIAGGQHIAAFGHGRDDSGGRPRVVQRIAACGPAHPWVREGLGLD
jgi:SAM-dependent methyltransferase